MLHQALITQQVDLIAALATDGALDAREETTLRDDRNCFPHNQAAIAVRQGALTRLPGLEKALRELSGKIGDAAIRTMNHEVDGKKHAAADVAREFLKGIA
jgi:glycine betaine/choline ABC-type transport system substrate-binding protein